jgi:DNA-binding transcriptional LysR family regulator
LSNAFFYSEPITFSYQPGEDVLSCPAMNLRFLETFVWVARLHSFKACANKLNLTQAAISGRIAVLENDIGQPLFDRNLRELPLTSAGLALLPYAQRLLDLEQSMRQSLGGLGELKGVVRLGIVESIVHTWFPYFIKQLSQVHPGLEIELIVEPMLQLHELLRRGSLDVVLQTDAVIDPGIENRDIGLLRLDWICAAASGLPARMSLTELASFPFVTFPRYSQPHKQLQEVLRIHEVQPTRIHFVSSISASRQLLLASPCTATLPVAAVRDGLADGSLRIVDCDQKLPALRLVASWRADPVADAVVQLALSEMRLYAQAWPDDAQAPSLAADDGGVKALE